MTGFAARFGLEGRAALVTGAGRGIGRACTLALAQAGAEVWLMARTKSEIDDAAAEIRASGGKAHALACDVTNSDEMRQAVAAIPVLDVLVNNAGSNIPEPFVEVSEEHLDRLLALNVRAAAICRYIGVSTKVGAMDSTRMPCVASSSAMALVRPSRACLVRQ